MVQHVHIRQVHVAHEISSINFTVKTEVSDVHPKKCPKKLKFFEGFTRHAVHPGVYMGHLCFNSVVSIKYDCIIYSKFKCDGSNN